jgi:putative MFS transporter
MQTNDASLSDTSAPALGALAVGHDTDEAAKLIARMERIPFSAWHLRARVVMGSATFFDAFDALSLAFALPVLTELWHISITEIGWLIAASYIGQLIGALMFSRLAEGIGRVPSAAIATAIMSVMCIGCVLSGNFMMLFVCRFIQGIGVGGEMPVAAAYISELSRAHGRGKFFLLYEMIFPVGLMATGQLGTFLVPAYGWQALFLVGGIPGMIIAVAVYFLPESPRWLIGRGRLADAEKVIKMFEASARKRYPNFESEPVPVAAVGALTPSGRIVRRSRWGELLSPFYRSRTLIAWTLWATAYFVANSLNNWLPTLYKSVYKLPIGDALRAASMTNVAQVVLLLICAFCIDRVGRRLWAMTCFLVGGALLAILGFGASASLAAVIVLTTLAYGVIGSVAAVLYLYTPEIYPTRMRAIGTGLSTSWLRAASAAGPPIVGTMLANGGIHSVFLMFTGVAVIGAIASYWIIETRNRQLEDIAP